MDRSRTPLSEGGVRRVLQEEDYLDEDDYFIPDVSSKVIQRESDLSSVLDDNDSDPNYDPNVDLDRRLTVFTNSNIELQESSDSDNNSAHT